MSKLFKLIFLLLSMTLVVVGCRTDSAQEVATYDEAYDQQQRDRYRELNEYLYDEYEDNLKDMTRDPLYPEYERLNGMFSMGGERRWEIFKATEKRWQVCLRKFR